MRCFRNISIKSGKGNREKHLQEVADHELSLRKSGNEWGKEGGRESKLKRNGSGVATT